MKKDKKPRPTQISDKPSLGPIIAGGICLAMGAITFVALIVLPPM